VSSSLCLWAAMAARAWRRNCESLLALGERKVGRLMRENAMAVKRNKKFKGKEDQDLIQ